MCGMRIRYWMGAHRSQAVGTVLRVHSVQRWWKNKDEKLDPEIHQTKKGNLWHFGMKAHISALMQTQGWCTPILAQQPR